MLYRFYDYMLDPASRELRHGPHRLALEPKVFQVLLYLLEHRDRLVPKAELLEQCWPETFVSESALTRCLARLRKAVPAPPTAPPVIATRHRQGYRFVAAVTVLAQALPPALDDTAPLQTAAPAMPPVSSDTPALPAPRLSAPLPPPATRPTAPGAERRQLTVLFCDVVDSTSLAGRLDPEDYRDIMGRYHATCTAVIERYGGHVAQYLGDGLLVYVGWPQAHEDDARRAVHAGLALVTAVRGLGSTLGQDYGLRLAVRIGMHTGLVVVGTGAEDTPYGQLAVGATPNLAAKVQALAAPDAVVLSAATYALVQGYFGGRAHVTLLSVPRLAAPQVMQMVHGLGGDVLPAAQRRHIVRQTDGVPLFIEEVTKFVLAAQRLQGQTGRPASASAAPEMAIPATLRDSLMARLDKLGPAKGTAQLGATIGREFAYALLQAVTPLAEEVIRQDLQQLVEAELLYQRGVGAAAVYQFKHALIQEAAYASLLRKTRQHYHQHIAQVLEAQCPDTTATQPELLAHHYTEAGLAT